MTAKIAKTHGTLKKTDAAVFDAVKMLLCGVSCDVVRYAFVAAGYRYRAIEKILDEAHVIKKAHLDSSVLPSRIEIVEMHKILYADALQAQKLDTATKVLRSLTDVVLSSPEGHEDFDEQNPRAYLTALLSAQASGKFVPATVLAATARAVNALDVSAQDPSPEVEVIDITPPKTVAEASIRALKIISGGVKK